ncbi:MAG: hypothetical protein V3V11_10895, partial [Vicinamibacteria bacterium]
MEVLQHVLLERKLRHHGLLESSFRAKEDRAAGFTVTDQGYSITLRVEGNVPEERADPMRFFAFQLEEGL